LVTRQQTGCQERRRQAGLHTGGWKALGRTTRRATSTLVSPRPAGARRLRRPDQRHETARRPQALPVSRNRWNRPLGRLGRGEQQPLGPHDHQAPPPQITLHTPSPTLKMRPIILHRKLARWVPMNSRRGDYLPRTIPTGSLIEKVLAPDHRFVSA